MASTALPTYLSAARFLERKHGSGIKLLGWTVARTLMIGPPMMLVGVSAKRAFGGALLASSLISLFAVLRLYDAGPRPALAGRRQPR